MRATATSVIHIIALLAFGGCATRFDAGTAIVDVTVVDVVDGRLRPHMTVVLEGDRIVAVEPSSSVRLGASVDRIDGAGRFLLPGPQPSSLSPPAS